MVKTFFLISILFATLTATPSKVLEKNCINCHITQKIPSELLYRRYLQKYSTHTRIQNKIFEYLKAPNKKNSIMPKQFFLKFPEKKALDLNETLLKESIKDYLEHFDIKKQLILHQVLE